MSPGLMNVSAMASPPPASIAVPASLGRTTALVTGSMATRRLGPVGHAIGKPVVSMRCSVKYTRPVAGT